MAIPLPRRGPDPDPDPGGLPWESRAPVEPVGDLEADTAVFLTLQEQEDAVSWALARWAYLMAGRYGRGVTRHLAEASGRVESTIRGLVAVWRAFPTPESRAQDLSFSHHVRASLTADPAGWLDRAVAHGWVRPGAGGGHPGQP